MTQILSGIAQLRTEKIQQELEAIRLFFQKPNSPYYYISYRDFCDNFEVHAAKNTKEQNLHIIDTHLKYRQWCFQEMAPYKWTPIISLAGFRLILLRSPPLILPLVYIKLFDYYFEPFFVWKNQDQKIINLRYEFATKLSKLKNKQRRVRLWRNLNKSFQRLDETGPNDNSQEKIPNKYIKFGFPTEYVFHAQVKDLEISTVLQTTFFETYMNFRYLTLDSFKQLLTHLNSLRIKFGQYKKDPSNQKYRFDLQKLLKFKDVKQQEKYLFSTSIEKRVRRWLQIFMYERTKNIYFSDWTMDKIFFLYKHKHLTEEPKYCIENNAADLSLYYSFVLLPVLILKLSKR